MVAGLPAGDTTAGAIISGHSIDKRVAITNYVHQPNNCMDTTEFLLSVLQEDMDELGVKVSALRSLAEKLVSMVQEIASTQSYHLRCRRIRALDRRTSPRKWWRDAFAWTTLRPVVALHFPMSACFLTLVG